MKLMFQTNHECAWLCMVGNLKKWKEGALKRAFEIKGQKLTLTATMDRSKVQEQAGGTNHWIQFEWDNTNISFAEILEAVGELPIPPYLIVRQRKVIRKLIKPYIQRLKVQWQRLQLDFTLPIKC